MGSFRQKPPFDLADFRARIEAGLEMDWIEIRKYWLDPVYAELFDRAWQNLIALSAQPGFNQQLAEQLVRTLVLGNLIARIIASEPEPPPETVIVGEQQNEDDTDDLEIVVTPPVDLAPLWPAERLRDGILATNILPGELFPLPPKAPSGEAATKPPKPIPSPVPYAIGDLRLVRQRLRRYELGEVSGIENVMQGELKETSQKRLIETRIEAQESESEVRESVQELAGQREDLVAETVNTLKENFHYHYETKYGPPSKQLTVIVDEKIKPLDDEPQEKTKSCAASVARQLTQRAASSLARRVNWQRNSTTVNRDEHSTVRRIDATQMEGNVRGIYRWVNKVYECWTVALGRRFILEFFVRDPAQAFIAGSFSLRGLCLREPKPLIDFGVRTFRDISTDPKSPAFYANLAAEYDVVDLQPPPAPTQLSSVSFQGDEPITRQTIPLAPGYEAKTAQITVAPAPGATKLQLSVVVGRYTYHYPEDPTKGAAIATKNPNLNAETGVVQAAVLSSIDGAKPLASTAYTVTVEVCATLGDHALNEWKLAIFKSISKGYASQRDRYFETVGSWPTQRHQANPLNGREVVRNELRRDIMRQLIRHTAMATGEKESIAVGQPRYTQFLERALAWREMAYAFTVKTEDDIGTVISQQFRGEDELFSAFLQAGVSRVLLPVTPDYAYRVLYFLATGQIWTGVDELTPTVQPLKNGSPDDQFVDLINALKTAADSHREPQQAESWEVVVPTDLTVIQEGSELPDFGGNRS